MESHLLVTLYNARISYIPHPLSIHPSFSTYFSYDPVPEHTAQAKHPRQQRKKEPRLDSLHLQRCFLNALVLAST